MPHFQEASDQFVNLSTPPNKHLSCVSGVLVIFDVMFHFLFHLVLAWVGFSLEKSGMSVLLKVCKDNHKSIDPFQNIFDWSILLLLQFAQLQQKHRKLMILSAWLFYLSVLYDSQIIQTQFICHQAQAAGTRMSNDAAMPLVNEI